MKQILPGITKIGTVETLNLERYITFKAMSKIQIQISQNDIVWLEIVGNATGEVEEKYDNNNMSESVKLDFKSTEMIAPFPRKAVVICTVEGDYFLVGADNKAAKINRKKSTGTPSDNAAYNYEVDFTAKKAIVKVILT